MQLNKKRNRRRKKRHKTDLQEVVANFVPCGRCSFFLSGYRTLHGQERLAELASESEGRWLELDWDYQTRELVQKSYGNRLDVAHYYLDSRCPECQRRFMFQEAEQEGEPDTFCIEMKGQ